MFPWVVSRLSEPSTWVGLGLLVSSVPQALHGDFGGVFQAVAGLFGVAMEEKHG